MIYQQYKKNVNYLRKYDFSTQILSTTLTDDRIRY